MRGLVYLQLLLLLVIKCSCVQREYYHPLESNLPAEEFYTEIVSMSDSIGLNQHKFPEFFYDLNSASSKVYLNDYTFSNEDEMIINDNGDFFLINRYEYSVDWLTEKGKLKQRIGRGGRGPGEFENIKGFTFDYDFERLFVLDNLSIKVFHYDNESGLFVYITSINDVFMDAFDICYLDGNLYLSAFDINREFYDELNKLESRSDQIKGLKKVTSTDPIVVIDPDQGKVINYFGYKIKSVSGFGVLDGILSEVEISCNSSTQTVIAKPKYAPMILGYTSDGNLKWTTKIKGIRDEMLLEKLNPYYGVSWAKTANNSLFDRSMPFREIRNTPYLVLEFEEKFLVKKFSQEIPDYLREFNFTVSLIDSRNGKIHFVDNTEKYFLGASSDHYIYSIYDIKSEIHDFYISTF
jgi:hypothetical protein